MIDEQKKKLGELKIELDAYVLMSQLVESISNDEGEWKKANKKWPHSDNVVYWNDAEGYGIMSDGDGNFKAFNNEADFVCPITLPKFVEVIKELAPKPKAKKRTAKKPAGKKYEIVFREIYGKPIEYKIEVAYAHIEAADEEEARRFALEDMLVQEWSNVELNWSDDECEIEEGVWELPFSFGMNGKHGEYGGGARVISSEFSEANDRALQTFKKGGMVVPTERPFFSTREMTN